MRVWICARTIEGAAEAGVPAKARVGVSCKTRCMVTVAQTINQGIRRIPTWAAYSVAFLPAPYFFYLALSGGLGPEPIKPLEHKYGEIALQLLIVSLAVTPLRDHLGVNLIKFRRAIGVMAFVYLVFHMMVWAILDVQTLDRVIADIIKRPYITIGMAGFALLLPLALTSNNFALRKMGAAGWRRLHRLTYLAVPLGALHFVWLAKGFQIEPLIYLAVILGLLALRVKGSRVRQPS